MDPERALELLPLDDLLSYLDELTEGQFLDVTPDIRLTDREATDLMRKSCGVGGAADFQRLDREMHSRYLRALALFDSPTRQADRGE